MIENCNEKQAPYMGSDACPNCHGNGEPFHDGCTDCFKSCPCCGEIKECAEDPFIEMWHKAEKVEVCNDCHDNIMDSPADYDFRPLYDPFETIANAIKP